MVVLGGRHVNRTVLTRQSRCALRKLKRRPGITLMGQNAGTHKAAGWCELLAEGGEPRGLGVCTWALHTNAWHKFPQAHAKCHVFKPKARPQTQALRCLKKGLGLSDFLSAMPHGIHHVGQGGATHKVSMCDNMCTCNDTLSSQGVLVVVEHLGFANSTP